MSRATRGSRRYWIGVTAYVLALFAIQPRLGFWVDAFKGRWGTEALNTTAWVVVVVGGLLVVALLAGVWVRIRLVGRVVLVVSVGLYAVGVAALEIPQERLHYLEYGLLSALLCLGFAAAAPERRWRAAVVAVATAAALGYLDEQFQEWFWERRYFDWRDVWLNMRAAVLGVMVALPIHDSRQH